MDELKAEQAAVDVVRAWTEEGPAPAIHRRAQQRLAVEWPTLTRAILDLVEARRG